MSALLLQATKESVQPNTYKGILADLQENITLMVIEEEIADTISIIMAAVSVIFMGPALAYAYIIRNHLSKALLILAVSKHLYRYLFMVLGFAALGSIAHLVYHTTEYESVSEEVSLLIHITIDSSFILVSASLLMTFRTAYGMLQKTSAAKDEVEQKLRESALRLTQLASNKNQGDSKRNSTLKNDDPK